MTYQICSISFYHNGDDVIFMCRFHKGFIIVVARDPLCKSCDQCLEQLSWWSARSCVALSGIPIHLLKHDGVTYTLTDADGKMKLSKEVLPWVCCDKRRDEHNFQRCKLRLPRQRVEKVIKRAKKTLPPNFEVGPITFSNCLYRAYWCFECTVHSIEAI